MNRGTSKAYVIGLAVFIFAALAVHPRHPVSAQVSDSSTTANGQTGTNSGGGGDPSLTSHPTNSPKTPVGGGHAQPAQSNSGGAAQPDNQGSQGGGGCCG